MSNDRVNEPLSSLVAAFGLNFERLRGNFFGMFRIPVCKNISSQQLKALKAISQQEQVRSFKLTDS